MLRLPDLSKLSLHGTEPTDARRGQRMQRPPPPLQKCVLYDADEQWLILEHAITVAWMLKQETANLDVFQEVSNARANRGLPDEVTREIERLARTGPARQEAFQPTNYLNVNRLSLEQAVGYYRQRVGPPAGTLNEVTMQLRYRMIVRQLKNYVVSTYGMQIAYGLPNIQKQRIMSDILEALNERFSSVQWPDLVMPARDYAPSNPKVAPPRRRPGQSSSVQLFG